MLMRRLLFLLLTISMFFVSGFSPVKAFTANPSSGTFAPGASINMNLPAVPQTGENALEINIQVTNMTITNYTPPASSGSVTWVPIADPTCPTFPNFFNATQICYSLAKVSGGNITAGESLGTIAATSGSVGTATVSKVAGNAYVGGSSRADVGQIASFTIATGGSTGNTLPSTGIGEGLLEQKFLFFGLTFVSLGLLAYTILAPRKLDFKDVIRIR